MKKMLLVMAAGTLFAAGMATADTVTSVNVVGYHSVTIPANGIALVTPVLESFNACTLNDLVGAQLPSGSFAWIWDRTSNSYVADSRGRAGWSSTNVILRGDAVWLKPSGTNVNTVTFMGEVPGDYNQAETTTVHNIAGTDAVGYTYPVNMIWTNTTLSTGLAAGASIVVWNLQTQAYETYSKTRAGWSTPAGYTIPAGQAFWVRTAVPFDWTEAVPYNL